MDFNVESIDEEMPNFQNHDEAREWFKNLFGNRFSLRSSVVIDGKEVYFYHMIKDPDMYQNYMQSFASPVKHEISNMETFESYSTVEISEDGAVNFLL